MPQQSTRITAQKPVANVKKDGKNHAMREHGVHPAYATLAGSITYLAKEIDHPLFALA